MQIPYAVEARRDTGVNNTTLGIWLFLASEVMLFGGLFSAYVSLRQGAAQWKPEFIWPGAGVLLSVPLLAAALTNARALRAARAGLLPHARAWLLATLMMSGLFVALKCMDYVGLARSGVTPATSTYFSVYFLLTGVHLAHVAGGLVVVGWLAAGGAGVERARLTNRIGATGLYWYFVDVVWLLILLALYVL